MENQQYNDFLRKMFPNIDSVSTVPKITEYQPTEVVADVPSSSSSGAKLAFKDLLSYKTTRCENPHCPHNPRTTVPNNQYLETELQCPGYHHTKDARRPPIKDLKGFTGEFEYQANYFKEGRCQGDKNKFSQNFFESLYHPLYYKQFSCKRSYCDKSKYCPYFHSEREKIEWELIFEQNLKVNRKVFLSTKTRQGGQETSSGYRSPGSLSDESETPSRSPLMAGSGVAMNRRLESKGAAFEHMPMFQRQEDSDIFKPFQYNPGYQTLMHYGKTGMPPFLATQF
jgi:hypothetical protein